LAAMLLVGMAPSAEVAQSVASAALVAPNASPARLFRRGEARTQRNEVCDRIGHGNWYCIGYHTRYNNYRCTGITLGMTTTAASRTQVSARGLAREQRTDRAPRRRPARGQSAAELPPMESTSRSAAPLFFLCCSCCWWLPSGGLPGFGHRSTSKCRRTAGSP
jgi:hypothetical protein